MARPVWLRATVTDTGGTMRQFWNGLAGVVTKHYKAVLTLAAVVTVIMAFGITKLEFETSQDALIGADNPVAQDNERFQENFGGEPMLVLFSATEDGGKQSIDLVADEENAKTLAEFGDELRAATDANGDPLFHAVVSPVTAMNFAASQVTPGTEIFPLAEEYAPDLASDQVKDGEGTDEKAAARAEEVKAAVEKLEAGTTERVTAAGIDVALAAAELPNIDDQVKHEAEAIKVLSNKTLSEALLYESDAEDPAVVATDDEGNPVIRPILRANFPKIDQGLMIVTTQGNIDIADMGDAADKVVEIADKYKDSFEGFELTVGGPPQLLQDINDYLQTGLALLGALSFIVMVLVLYFVFRVRWRLLSLVIVVIGAIWGFGIMGYLGISLTLITIAALPILIGVGVDFSIQAHSRMEEEVNEDGNAPEGMRRLMRWLAPPLAVAAIAAVVGFLALNVSPVPMIGDFGVMLALGIIALFVAGLLVPTSILAWREKANPTKAGEALIPHGFLERVVRGMMFSMQKFVLPMAVVGVLIIILGLSFEGRFVIETDAEKWLPQDKNSAQCKVQEALGGSDCTDTIHDLEVLQDRAGFSSVLALLIEADDVTSDEVSSWAQQFTNQQLEKHGPDGDGTLKDVNSLYGVAFDITKTPPDQASMNLLIGKGLRRGSRLHRGPRGRPEVDRVTRQEVGGAPVPDRADLAG
ncbi:MAG: MMPL family transporter [Acidimicrobiia bacterium]|nr:MMPL family transporter [Acidimicrobiia bacterium]